MRSKLNSTVSAGALTALVIAPALFLWGCQAEDPASPSVVYVNQNQSVTVGGPSPSPGSGGLPEGSVVRVEVYGDSCPGGGQARPAPGQLKAGCSMAITCTPKDRNGTPLPPEIHGPTATWSVSGDSYVRVVPDGGNPFNAAALALAPGPAAITCTVKGVSGTLPTQVVP